MKTILITGASSGIGNATAKLFAADNNYQLILCGRRKDRIELLKNELTTSYNVAVHTLLFDIRSFVECEEAFKSLPDSFNKVDILLNNAGLALGLDLIHEGNLAHWETMIDTNIKGLLYMTRIISKGMVERNTGHIINIGSTAGKEVYPKGNVYCATKFAVDALSRAIRQDLVSFNVRVSQISPGHVEETEFALTRFEGDTEKSKIYQDFNALKPHDIAEIIYFVANRAAHINIQDILVMGTQQASSTNINRSGRIFDERV
ncbi:MAG: SDR family NAD(P)-dependent oxidoreductase [Bacteroidota bacterium]|nr:SDR family NAD(P)-dependent oxidoreductase [Bacteroidota bacterium]